MYSENFGFGPGGFYYWGYLYKTQEGIIYICIYTYSYVLILQFVCSPAVMQCKSQRNMIYIYIYIYINIYMCIPICMHVNVMRCYHF